MPDTRFKNSPPRSLTRPESAAKAALQAFEIKNGGGNDKFCYFCPNIGHLGQQRNGLKGKTPGNAADKAPPPRPLAGRTTSTPQTTMGFFSNIFSKKEKQEALDSGLEKTKTSLFEKITRAVAGKSKVDDEVLDQLEETLITSDVGTDTTLDIIHRIEERVARDKYVGTGELNRILKEEIADLLTTSGNDDGEGFALPVGKKPYVIMVVGVNGVGKTTTIGKLAWQFRQEGKKVVLGAADTFRAAAVEQLVIWGERAGVPVVKQQMGSDPASVAYDTVASAKASDADVVLIDTAGRLHNKVGLMNELTKIKRVMQKVVPDAPHEVLLVLDGSTGQNAYEQARQFVKATEVTSLAITKLDGTAKGGVVIGISHQLKVPVKYIGLGEKMTDLQPFSRKDFVETLFNGQSLG